MGFSMPVTIHSNLTCADSRRLSPPWLFALIVLLLSATIAVAQPYQAGVTSQQTGFVPRLPPFTDRQLDELESTLKKQGMSNKEIENRLWSARQGFEYRDEDIRAAVPELASTDLRVEQCSSMFGDLIAFTFRGIVARNQLTMTMVHCDPVDGGLSCRALRSSTHFFDASPEHHFWLSGVTFDEASAVLAAFKRGGIADIPEDFRKFSEKSVRGIKAVPDGYELSLGGMNACGGGCAFTVVVQYHKHGTGGVGQLRLVRGPEGMCV